MKRLLASLLTTLALLMAPAIASASSCPDGFHPHEIGTGDHDHEGHQHVGQSLDAVDRDDDGTICVKHLTEEIHLHIDDLSR